MKLRIGCGLVATTVLVAGFALAAPAQAATRTVNVTLALICDIYEMAEKNGRGGYARIASAIRAERERAANLIVAHAGDAISPSLMSGFDKGAHVMDLTNRLDLDVFVPGNHEFDFGPQVFRQRIAVPDAVRPTTVSSRHASRNGHAGAGTGPLSAPAIEPTCRPGS